MGTSRRRREIYDESWCPGVHKLVWYEGQCAGPGVQLLYCSHSSLYRDVHSGAKECSYSEGGSVTWTSSTQFLLVLSQPVTCHIVPTIVT